MISASFSNPDAVYRGEMWLCEEKTNISFTFETPIGTAYRERKSILFASGTIPDLFFGTDFTEGDITQFSRRPRTWARSLCRSTL